MKQVYILLSRTGTVPSHLIYTITKGTFTHTSLALTPETNRFYSYARRTMKNPLNAGFIIEDTHTQVFSLYPNCHCALYALNVSDEAYEKMQKAVDFFASNYDKAKYNFGGMLPLRLRIRIRRKLRLTCSQFVAVVLSASEEIQLPRDPYVMLPNDFLSIPSLQKIYDGALKDCRFPPSSAEIFANEE